MDIKLQKATNLIQKQLKYRNAHWYVVTCNIVHDLCILNGVYRRQAIKVCWHLKVQNTLQRRLP